MRTMNRNCRSAKILVDPNTGNYLIEEDCYIFAIDNSEDFLHIPCVVVADNKNQLINIGNETVKIIFNEEEQESEENHSDGENTEALTWPEEPTKLLISSYKTKKPLVEQGKLKTLKKMWEKIKFDMDQHGYSYSVVQIENKWKSLERAFKNKMENKTKTGRGRKSCPYEKELSDILTKRHSINPACTLGVEDEGNSERSETNIPLTATEHGESSSGTSTPNKTKRSANQNTILHELQELRKTISEKNKIKIDMEKEKCQQRKDIIDQLKKKNELLEKLLDKNS